MFVAVLAAGICGEGIARARFYERLRVVSPASQMRSDLNAHLAREGITLALD